MSDEALAGFVAEQRRVSVLPGQRPGCGRAAGGLVTDGEYAGQRGFFTRDASGEVTGVDLAGRLASRV